MLVIISDLHLTDGTSGTSLPPGAFQLFAERLQDLVLSASFRADGLYRPLECVDVVLLGDVLDVIRSAAWQGSDVRPWSGIENVNLANTVAKITNDILAHNEPGLRVLRGLATQNLLMVPPANRAGQPVYQVDGQPVPVRLHYMVGNHDWFYHVPGRQYDAIRQQIVAKLGLWNRPDTPFPHEPSESTTLIDLMRQHKIFARHGDIYDPFNYEGDRCASSLGDAIVIELINRFPAEVQQRLGDELPEALVAGLREIDNIRPTLLVPVWIDGLLERTCAAPAARKQVKAIWDDMADEFLANKFVCAHDTWSPVDIVDGLARVLKFSKRLSIGWASAIVNFLYGLQGKADESYYSHALTEQDFRNRRAQHIIYGHTHNAEFVPLDASYAEGFVLNQVYFNSGTWRRVHRPTQYAPSEHEFIPSESMTYLSFYSGGERYGRPYEVWTGTLGINPLENAEQRIDKPHLRPATTTQPAAAAVPAPHFAAHRAPVGIIPTRRKA